MFVNKLHKLAELYGIQPSYEGVRGKRVECSDKAIMAVLGAMGCPITKSEEASSHIENYHRSLWLEFCDPVLVAWVGEPATFSIRLTDELAREDVACRIQFEDGTQHEWFVPSTENTRDKKLKLGGVQYITKLVTFERTLPTGYHKLLVKVAWKSAESLLIVAPRTAFSKPNEEEKKSWGVFAPLYGLHSRKSLGNGSFSDLEALSKWVSQLGGNIVATLPFLATFLNEGFNPSPYSPASRLFWNEFYLDIEKIPELEECRAAQKILQSPEIKSLIEKAKSSALVDYKNIMAAKRKVLEMLSTFFFQLRQHPREEAFSHFLKNKPQVRDYAVFRALFEKQKKPWLSWPAKWNAGSVGADDYEKEVRDYHMYVQWIADEQLRQTAEAAERENVGLFLDFPLGVNPDSFDVWHYRSLFALNTRVGAPPDTVFTRGQDWGFPPLHPEKIRERGYDYWIACIRHHLKYGKMLRVDHVMGLHRLFWIPEGFKAEQGVYVRYRSEELYAILCLESHRAKSVIVGENLGIVPKEVNTGMRAHNIHQLFVLQYELPTNAMKNIRSVPADAVACLNTHDMPPFAAYWEGLDIPVRIKLGILNERDAEIEKREREKLHKNLIKVLQSGGWLGRESVGLEDILKACLAFLASSNAAAVSVNLEDLWGERAPQNIPSTQNEFPNWQRKLKYSMEDFSGLTSVMETLKSVDNGRKKYAGIKT